MEAIFDPAQFLTMFLVSLAQKHPIIHGLIVFNSVVVAVIPRHWFFLPKFGLIFRIMSLLSVLTPHGAHGTFKLPFTMPNWPELEAPEPTPPPVRVDRPSVVRAPSATANAEPHPAAPSDAPTPARGSVVPLPSPSAATASSPDDERGSMVPSAPSGSDDPAA